MTYSFSLSLFFGYYYMFVVHRLSIQQYRLCCCGRQPAASPVYILHSASFCFPAAARSPAKCCTRFRACCASFSNGIYDIIQQTRQQQCCCWRCAAGAGRARINRCRACGPAQTQPLFSRLFAGRWPAGRWALVLSVCVSYINSAGSK